jgi:cysteine desulfuration protein SufE
MSSIVDIEQEIIDEFSMFEEWMEKYEYIIELGKDLPLIDEQYKDEIHLVKGCQSQVWLHSELDNDQVVFTADSDAIITKGIIALLVRVLSNHTPDEIVNAELNFVEKVGLTSHLSPNRSNGLVAMMKQMKLDALAYKAKLES